MTPLSPGPAGWEVVSGGCRLDRRRSGKSPTAMNSANASQAARSWPPHNGTSRYGPPGPPGPADENAPRESAPATMMPSTSVGKRLTKEARCTGRGRTRQNLNSKRCQIDRRQHSERESTDPKHSPFDEGESGTHWGRRDLTEDWGLPQEISGWDYHRTEVSVLSADDRGREISTRAKECRGFAVL